MRITEPAQATGLYVYNYIYKMRDRLRNSNHLSSVIISYTSEEHGATGYLLFLTVLWTTSHPGI